MNPNTAAYYDNYWGGEACRSYLADRQLDEIAAHIVARIGAPPQCIVDLGGGISRIARLARDAGHIPLVVDFSATAVETMHAEGIMALCCDISRWTGEIVADWVDVVTCTEVLEHLTEPSVAVQMAAAHAPRAFFTVPNGCMGPEECDTHLRTYNASTLSALLMDAGWHVVDMRAMYRWLIAECVQ